MGKKISNENWKLFVSRLEYSDWLVAWACEKECERVMFDEWTGNRSKLSRATTDYSKWMWMILHITSISRTILCWHGLVFLVSFVCFFLFHCCLLLLFFDAFVHRLTVSISKKKDSQTNYFFASFIIFYQAYLFWNISVRYPQYLCHVLFSLDNKKKREWIKQQNGPFFR